MEELFPLVRSFIKLAKHAFIGLLHSVEVKHSFISCLWYLNRSFLKIVC